jgi:hypothetical protein
MHGPTPFKPRFAVVAAALSLLAASPVSATPHARATAAGKGNACSAVLRTLSPLDRQYVVAIMSMTYTQLAAAFGTMEVHVTTRPIDSCRIAS